MSSSSKSTRVVLSFEKKGSSTTQESITVENPDTTSIWQIKQQYMKKYGLNIYRQGLYLLINSTTTGIEKDNKKGMVSLSNNTSSLSHYLSSSSSHVSILVKDLGPQIGYKTVFILEYLGPLLFVFLYSLRPEFVYGKNDANNKDFHPTAMMGILCWSFHFMKRELETLFVHRFSRPTMPLSNLFKNCTYYWTFGLVIGYPLCHPEYTSPTSYNQIVLGLTLFIIAEILNLSVHLKLRNLRSSGSSQERPIPMVSVSYHFTRL